MCKVLLGVHNLFYRIISFVSQYYRFILSNQVLLHRRQVGLMRHARIVRNQLKSLHSLARLKLFYFKRVV